MKKFEVLGGEFIEVATLSDLKMAVDSLLESNPNLSDKEVFLNIKGLRSQTKHPIELKTLLASIEGAKNDISKSGLMLCASTAYTSTNDSDYQVILA